MPRTLAINQEITQWSLDPFPGEGVGSGHETRSNGQFAYDHMIQLGVRVRGIAIECFLHLFTNWCENDAGMRLCILVYHPYLVCILLACQPYIFLHLYCFFKSSY